MASHGELSQTHQPHLLCQPTTMIMGRGRGPTVSFCFVVVVAVVVVILEEGVVLY